MNKTRQATLEWEQEVDEMAAKLIQGGIAPFDAVKQADYLVGRARRAKLDEQYDKIMENIGAKQ